MSHKENALYFDCEQAFLGMQILLSIVTQWTTVSQAPLVILLYFF